MEENYIYRETSKLLQDCGPLPELFVKHLERLLAALHLVRGDHLWRWVHLGVEAVNLIFIPSLERRAAA